MGTEGNLTNPVIKAMSVTTIPPTPFNLSDDAFNFLKENTKQSPYFLPIRMMVRGENVNGQGHFDESINYVLQG